MKIAKWGNSLAVRLPLDLVNELGLREGDKIDLVGENGVLSVTRVQRPDEILSDLRAFRGRLPSADRLSRKDANDR